MLNKQHLPLLREAHRLIEIGQERMFCFAVAAACGGSTRLLAEQINAFVDEGIGDEGTLISWMRTQMKDIHPKPAALQDLTTWGRIDSAVRGQRDLMRMAWIDRIIADIEAQP